MSSLFPNFNNQNKPATSSLFGTATSSSPSGSTLFGSTAAAQPQQAASTSQPTPSLFTGLGTSQQPQQADKPAATGGLFGGLGASTAKPAPAASSSAFGGLGSTFGQAANQTAAAASTTQGGQAQPTGGPLSQSANANPQSAYFDHLLERGKKRNKQDDGGNQFGDLPPLQLGLGDIARKVRNLGTGGPSAPLARDSRAHYLLAASGVQTGSALRDLNSFNAQASAAAPPPIAVDTDLDGYIANFHAQSTLSMIQEGLEQSRRDFDAFLEENVQMEWDAQRRRIYEHFGLVKPGEKLDTGSNGQSTNGTGAFGKSSRRGKVFGGSKSGAAFGASQSVIGSTRNRGFASGSINESPEKGGRGASLPKDRFQRDKQEKFADKVTQLNVSRLEWNVYPILQNFAEVEAQAGIDDTASLVDAYRAIAEIAQENAVAVRFSDPGAVRERQYAKEYLDESKNSGLSVAMRKRILNGSRRFLEKRFYEDVETAIAKNPREANLGGIPTTINKVRAYVRLRSARRELGPDNVELQRLGEDYCWVLIFYLLRCGLISEAAQYVKENERPLKNMERNFPMYMNDFANSRDRRLSADSQKRIAGEYSQKARLAPENSLDPYKMACFKIIGRCELSKRGLDGVNLEMNDWVWLQFALAREVNRVEEAAGEAFGLDNLRDTIREIGQRHFSQGTEGVGVFFFLQILAGLFEQAVHYLYQHNYVSAVHFAIALDYYGFLRVADFFAAGSELLTYTTTQLPQINFARMIGYYTHDFRAGRAGAAADYLVLICLNAGLPGQVGQSHATTCHEALRELVLETREFALLLGDIRNDGQKIKGVIEQRLRLIGLSNQDEFLKTVTVSAANVADESGRVTDAVLLYHLADEYDQVYGVLSRALADVVATDLGQQHMRVEPLKPRADVPAPAGANPADPAASSSLSLMSVDDPVRLAQAIYELYRNAAPTRAVKMQSRTTLQILLQLCQAKALIEQRKWSEALDVIRATNTLPFDANGNTQVVRGYVANFAGLSPPVVRNVGAVLAWTVTACGQQRRVLLASQFDDPNRRAMAEALLQVARDLMVFAGLIRYKLAPRVYEALAAVGQEIGA